uniref:Quercetin 3-O-glucoside-6''-O-malonyltransferase n=1 Tax=Lamium purpureum TaxID=53164 RepID=Q6RFS5_LAMPU|nr:quercetin 3-O-glucoside-6''-O-malonyltransferase [Lamium purpureum]
MNNSAKKVNVLEHSGVAPAAAADEVAEQRLPLTYFDVLWLYFHPIKRLLFYQHPCSATHFLQTIIPNLKNSLSQTLRRYPPLAGHLFYPLDSGFPELRYLPGDSVTVTFAESTEAFDFNYLTGDQARVADEFHHFVPDLPQHKIDSDSGFRIIPLLAIQVTLFPETGISVGFTNNHVAGDASSIVGFIKAWSSSSKLGHFAENLDRPLYDRSVIKDPSGKRANIFWNQMRAQIWPTRSNPPSNRVRKTFVLQSKDIKTLKDLVLAREANFSYLSSFTVTIAHVWACLAKSSAEAGEEVEDAEPEYFGVAVDARSRLDPTVPATYFGNCITLAAAESRRGEMKGKDGFFVAAELIGDVMSKKVNKKGELMRDADELLVKYAPLFSKRFYGVSGSPKFDLYDTDFGWGNPNKFEALSIDEESYSISLCKSREFEGGLEIGVSFPERKMDAFQAVFYDRLGIQT